MKVIVTHNSPDMDAITSVWLIRKFLAGWGNAAVQFVPAGERIGNVKSPIEIVGENEIIHVDTGLGPLDHHQIFSDKVCAASLTWDCVRIQSFDSARDKNSDRIKTKIEAISRIVKVVVDIDHFKEVFWENPTADYHEFSLMNILDGLKIQKPDSDSAYVDFVSNCLDALLHEFENRIWAEKEIARNGQKFDTRFGKGIGFENINDSVIKLAQKMGYVIVVRKDPRKGYVRVKARPSRKLKVEKGKLKNISQLSALSSQLDDIDLTLVYEKLKKMDPQATWFLHISKKMLLNGTVKNPKMRPSKLTLNEIIKVLENV